LAPKGVLDFRFAIFDGSNGVRDEAIENRRSQIANSPGRAHVHPRRCQHGD
jgi:hypothetical protein